MYGISLSSALFLFGMHAMDVVVAATGVILGWPFSILAFFPVTVYSLLQKFKRAFISGAFMSITLYKKSCYEILTFYFLTSCYVFVSNNFISCGLLLLWEMDIIYYEFVGV